MSDAYLAADMLSAAVVGEVFTSPSSDSVLAAIQVVSGKPGALSRHFGRNGRRG
jgi:dihydroxyacetone kinase